MNAARCGQCGMSLPSDADPCPQCGARVPRARSMDPSVSAAVRTRDRRTVLIVGATLVVIPLLIATFLAGLGWDARATLRPLLLVIYGFECFALWMPSTWIPSAGTFQQYPSPSELRAMMREKRMKASQRWGVELLSIGPAAGFVAVALTYLVIR